MAGVLVRRFPLSFRLLAPVRQFTVGGVLANKKDPVEDPVKKLFLDKMKEYKTKSKGGKLPDMTPQAEKDLGEELGRLKRIYGEGDLEKFPSFDFKDPQLSSLKDAA